MVTCHRLWTLYKLSQAQPESDATTHDDVDCGLPGEAP